MSTYVPIQAITLSSAAASVDFTGIPQTYTDLVIVASARYVSTNTGQGLGIRFNGDTTSNYSFTILEGNGSAASSYRVSNTSSGAMGAIANGSQTSFAVVSTSIQNYTNNTTNKTYIARQSGPSFVQGIVGLWRATPAPITSISIFGSGTAGNIDSGSTFTLYGVGTGSPLAFGGDEVRTDGTYWYHIYRSSGRFEPVQNLSNVDFLVIAGGGGGAAISSGGAYGAPGGGAGGYRTSVGTSGRNSSPESSLNLTSGVSYTVTVGAGGAGNNVGSNSVFDTITSLGGGALVGGSSANGGSGGGSFDFAPQNVPGPGTANQGFGGGAGAASTSPGGGGGAGGAGSTARQGGVGITSSISGSAVGRAGGGGGGYTSSTNATDGGGSGGISPSNNGSNATANTGGGGGGGAANGTTTSGGAGGSGIVIIRYAV